MSLIAKFASVSGATMVSRVLGFGGSSSRIRRWTSEIAAARRSAVRNGSSPTRSW